MVNGVIPLAAWRSHAASSGASSKSSAGASTKDIMRPLSRRSAAALWVAGRAHAARRRLGPLPLFLSHGLSGHVLSSRLAGALLDVLGCPVASGLGRLVGRPTIA